MSKSKTEAFETFEFDLPPIRGFPELRWAGKRPFTSTQYFPAQKKEAYGDPTDGWWNRLYWGDNLQVMAHLLREFRGEIDLIYIDPPFDSNADYKRKIKVRGASTATDYSTFEEKQYEDIWTSDQYLQYMYERLVLINELLKDTGSLFLHCDPRRVHHLRSILDEVFGPENFANEIVWCYKSGGAGSGCFSKKHDNILVYAKQLSKMYFSPEKEKSYMAEGSGKNPAQTYYEDDQGTYTLVNVKDYWTDIGMLATSAHERTGYPTEKPPKLLERIINTSCPLGGIVFDAFMGSGVTPYVALRSGRRAIGADINSDALQTTAKRLNNAATEISGSESDMFRSDVAPRYKGLEIYNVNDYDLFRNPVEAKELIKDALELQPLSASSIFDGQRDTHLVKIMPVNRIATRQDLNEVINGLDFKAFERRAAEAPSRPVERIHLVCMGHEPDLGAELQKAAKPFDIEVLVTDLIRDKAYLHFKRASDARLGIEDGHLVIAGFYPMNLLQKLSMEADAVEDWRQLVESVKVDWNYDGAVLTPAIVDAPDKDGLVTGRYPIPSDAATIRVKITDLLSESWEGEITNG